MINGREALAACLLCVQVAMVWPLLRAAFTAPDKTGVSLLGELAWVAAGAGWAAHGLLLDQPPVAVSGLVAMMGSGAMAAVVWQGAANRLAGCAAAAVAGVFIASGVLGGSAGLGTALAAFGVVQFLPHLWTAVALRRSGRPVHGVSVVGTALRAGYAAGWAWYGLGPVAWGAEAGSVSWPLVAWGVAGAVTFAVQAAAAIPAKRLAETRRRRLVQPSPPTAEPLELR